MRIMRLEIPFFFAYDGSRNCFAMLGFDYGTRARLIVSGHHRYAELLTHGLIGITYDLTASGDLLDNVPALILIFRRAAQAEEVFDHFAAWRDFTGSSEAVGLAFIEHANAEFTICIYREPAPFIEAAVPEDLRDDIEVVAERACIRCGCRESAKGIRPSSPQLHDHPSFYYLPRLRYLRWIKRRLPNAPHIFTPKVPCPNTVLLPSFKRSLGRDAFRLRHNGGQIAKCSVRAGAHNSDAFSLSHLSNCAWTLTSTKFEHCWPRKGMATGRFGKPYVTRTGGAALERVPIRRRKTRSLLYRPSPPPSSLLTSSLASLIWESTKLRSRSTLTPINFWTIWAYRAARTTGSWS
jgi:hypothetical protein